MWMFVVGLVVEFDVVDFVVVVYFCEVVEDCVEESDYGSVEGGEDFGEGGGFGGDWDMGEVL